MEFQHPTNGYIETSNLCWLWTLLFGSFYLAVKRVWSHAVVSFGLACFTMGASWLIYPFFAKNIVRKSYLRKGWTEIVPLTEQVEVHPQQ